MIRHKSILFTVAGSFLLVVSIGLRQWMHGGHSDFVSGFLIGVSIGLLILGLARPSRGVSR